LCEGGDYRKDSDIDVAVIIPKNTVSDDILSDMAKLFKLRRTISTDIELILLIDEEDEICSSFFCVYMLK